VVAASARAPTSPQAGVDVVLVLVVVVGVVVVFVFMSFASHWELLCQ
jgi:hypothetical protein